MTSSTVSTTVTIAANPGRPVARDRRRCTGRKMIAAITPHSTAPK